MFAVEICRYKNGEICWSNNSNKLWQAFYLELHYTSLIKYELQFLHTQVLPSTWIGSKSKLKYLFYRINVLDISKLSVKWKQRYLKFQAHLKFSPHQFITCNNIGFYINCLKRSANKLHTCKTIKFFILLIYSECLPVTSNLQSVVNIQTNIASIIPLFGLLSCWNSCLFWKRFFLNIWRLNHIETCELLYWANNRSLQSCRYYWFEAKSMFILLQSLIAKTTGISSITVKFWPTIFKKKK